MQCAIELFGANGIKGTTLDQIASAAGVSKKTIYFIFRSKEDLVREVYGWKMSAVARSVDEVLGLELSAIDKLARYLQVIDERIKEISLKSFLELSSSKIFPPEITSEYLKQAVFIRFNSLLEQAKEEGCTKDHINIGSTLMGYWNMLSPFLLVEKNAATANIASSNFELRQVVQARLLQFCGEILTDSKFKELKNLASNKGQISN